MKQTVSKNYFRDAFARFEDRKDTFSYEGLGALFDYLEEYENATGDEIELDVIALCCEYTEYSDIKEFQENYGEEYENIEDIENCTTVIRVGVDGFIIQDF